MSSHQPNGAFEPIQASRFLDLSEARGESTAFIYPYGTKWHSVEIKRDGLETFLRQYGAPPPGTNGPLYNRPWVPLAIALDLARNWRVRGDGHWYHLQDGLSDAELEFRGIRIGAPDDAKVIEGTARDISDQLAIEHQPDESQIPLRNAPAASIDAAITEAYADAGARGEKPPNINQVVKPVQENLKVKGYHASKYSIQQIASQSKYDGLRLKSGKKFNLSQS